MALKWFKKNKDKKNDKQDQSEQDTAVQSSSSEEIDQPQIDEPDALELEDQKNDVLQDTIDESEFLIDKVTEESSETTIEEGPAKKEKSGYFKRLRERLFKSRKSLSTGFDSIFTGKTKIDDDILEELEEHLITSDIGVQTTIDLIQKISKAQAKDASQVKSVLKDEILSILTSKTDAPAITYGKPHVVLVVGVIAAWRVRSKSS